MNNTAENKKYLICYYVTTKPDGKVCIIDSFDHCIVSDNWRELLDFLYKPFRGPKDVELKFFYKVDDSMAHIFRLMPVDLCKKIYNAKSFTDAKNTDCPFYYSRTRSIMIFGDQVLYGDKPYWSHIYSLDNLNEGETYPQNVTEVYKLACKWLEAVQSMMPNKFPIRASSMFDAWDSCYSRYFQLTPSSSFVPNKYLKLLEYALETKYKPGWKMNYKIGLFKNPYSYDLSSAYGYWLSQIGDFARCEIIPYTPDYALNNLSEINKGKVTGWFNVDLSINPEIKVHPYGDKRILTFEEMVYISKNKLGTFKVIDGFYVHFLTTGKPMEVWTERVFNWRDKGDLINKLSKALIVSYIGRTVSDFVPKQYNPLIGSWIYSKCRLQVLDLILKNNLDVIAVSTDGVLSTNPVTVTPINKEKKVMGTWRENKPSPAIVLSPGWVITNEKHPHSFDYETAISMLKKSPTSNYYKLEYDGIVTLWEAIEIFKDMRQIGKTYKKSESIDFMALMSLQGKDFDEMPLTGKDILSGRIYE